MLPTPTIRVAGHGHIAPAIVPSGPSPSFGSIVTIRAGCRIRVVVETRSRIPGGLIRTFEHSVLEVRATDRARTSSQADDLPISTATSQRPR